MIHYTNKKILVFNVYLLYSFSCVQVAASAVSTFMGTGTAFGVRTPVPQVVSETPDGLSADRTDTSDPSELSPSSVANRTL